MTNQNPGGYPAEPCDDSEAGDRLSRKAPPPGRQWCKAKSKRRSTPELDAPCANWAIRGGVVCDDHGGASAKVKAAAERRWQEWEAAKEVRRLLMDPNATPIKNPVERLQKLAGQLGSAVDLVTARVNELTSVEVEGGDERGPQLQVEVALWERLLREFRACLVEMARLGIEDRSVRVSEAQGVLVAGVVQAIVAALLERVVPELRVGDGERLRLAWPTFVGEVVPRELRALAGPDAG